MNPVTFRLPAGVGSAVVLGRIRRFLEGLPSDQAFDVTVQRHKPRRSLAQNALLWSLYGDILEGAGERMRGWQPDDLHEFFLGEHYGWEKLDGLKRARLKPLRRSSTMNKQDFSDHIDFIVRYMAEQGVVLTLPGEQGA